MCCQRACHLALLGDRGNSLLVPDETLEHPCTAKGPEVVVPVTWQHRRCQWLELSADVLLKSPQMKGKRRKKEGIFIKGP